jgi:mono/diheme cytochrome c family protein
MILRKLLSAALVFAVTLTLSSSLRATNASPVAAPQTKPDDEHPKFPPGDGRELTIKVCSTCHDAEVLADQALDEEGWKNMVSQMAGMGATATEAQLDEIVKYLTKAFPPK